MGDTILRVDDIQKFYGNKGNLTKAIDHISFSVRKGEFLGIMGASGAACRLSREKAGIYFSEFQSSGHLDRL